MSRISHSISYVCGGAKINIKTYREAFRLKGDSNFKRFSVLVII